MKPTNGPVLKVFLEYQGTPTLSHVEKICPKNISQLY